MKDFAEFIEAALVFLVLCLAFGAVAIWLAIVAAWDTVTAKVRKMMPPRKKTG